MPLSIGLYGDILFAIYAKHVYGSALLRSMYSYFWLTVLFRVQLGASPSVMFGEDIAWYARGITNQHSRSDKDSKDHQPDGRGVRKQFVL